MTPKSSKRPRESFRSTESEPTQAKKRILFSDANSDNETDVEIVHFEPTCMPIMEQYQIREWNSFESSMKEEKLQQSLSDTQTTEADTFSDISLKDPSSSELDSISTDDEEALEEYLIYKQARIEKKRAKRSLKLLGKRGYDNVDEVNVRYLVDGTPSEKPCTLTSIAGSAAYIDMKRIMMPAHEMLRNYFRTAQPKRVRLIIKKARY